MFLMDCAITGKSDMDWKRQLKGDGVSLCRLNESAQETLQGDPKGEWNRNGGKTLRKEENGTGAEERP